MSKYDYSLDLENRNSLSVLLQMIEPNSNILEFGPAHGRMTRYLKETLKCTVTIVELCEEAGKEAAQYAKQAFLGPEKGNIETYIWSKEINEKFDYIIFADVLEHLHNPKKALETCKAFLNDKGSILVSIPNVAHNSIIINLLNDKFEYTPIGLLDDTHIHLFTYNSFKNLIKEIGLTSIREEAIYANVGENEIKNSYQDVPSEICKYLKERLSGQIYQYIFQISVNKSNKEQFIINDIGQKSCYEAICYYKTVKDKNFNEENTIRVKYHPSQNKVEFNLKGINNISELRIDLIDEPCIVSYNKIYALNDKIEIPLSINVDNAQYIIDNISLYNTSDPNIIIKVEQPIQKLIVEFKFIDYGVIDSKAYNYLFNILNLKYKEQDKLENLIQNLKEEQNQIIVKQNQLLVEKEQLILDKDQLIQRNDQLIDENNKTTQYLNDTLHHVEKLNIYIAEKIDYINDLERVKNELEIISHELTIKGRIKKGIKKVGKLFGISKDTSLYQIIKHPEYIKKGIKEVKTNGIKGLNEKINNTKKKEDIAQDYSTIIANETHYNIKEKIQALTNKPFLSIVMPVYNVEPKWLEKAIASITTQTYPNWELCIVNDCSTNKETEEYLDKLKVNTIKVKHLAENKGISEATNLAVEMTKGEYIILMDNDDEIREEALYYVAEAINKTKADILYSDEDKINMQGQRKNPFYKPDWSPDLLYSQMYICHLLIFKKSIFEKVGGFRTEFNGSQDYDLMLRMSEITNHIVHIPRVLYSWREIPTSTALNPDSKPYAHTAGLKALDEHLKRKYKNAYATESDYLFVYDARFKIDQDKHKVSIIIPTKDKIELLDPCIESIIKKTTYKNYEIIILNNNSELEETYKWFKEVQNKYDCIRVIEAKYEFNWSKLNNQGIREAKGDVYVFLNNDTVVISEDWLERLAENALRDDIGTVGALLLYEDNTIQHAGVVLGMGGWADHVFQGMQSIHFGAPYVSPVINRNVLACTGACLAISKKVIEKIGNFDEKFVICGSDVEISLRARKYGLYNLYNARVKLYHLESKSRDSYIPPIDFEMSKLHYEKYINEGDPYYNQNLDLFSKEPKIKG